MASSGISWEELKASISAAFSCSRIDVEQVKGLMASYISKRSDWSQYEHFDKHK